MRGARRLKVESWLISMRIPSGDPVAEAFTDRTYELLEDFVADFEQSVGSPEAPVNFVLIASDFLIATQRGEASWERLDVRELQAFVCEHMPSLAPQIPFLTIAIGAFYSFLYKRGVVTQRCAIRVHDVMDEYIPQILAS